MVKNHKGLEVFILAGEANLQSSSETLPLAQYSWVRQPVGESFKLVAKGKVQLWLKQDHLVEVNKQVKRLGRRPTT